MKWSLTIKRVACLLAVGLLAAAAITGLISAQSVGLPMPLGLGAAVVVSGSMEPALAVNDVVILRRTASCAPGDIVAYRSGEKLIIHRVVEAGEDEIVTRGDANRASDRPFSRAQLVGRVALVLPGLGAAVDFVQKPAVIIAVLCISAALLLISFLPGRRENGNR